MGTEALFPSVSDQLFNFIHGVGVHPLVWKHGGVPDVFYQHHPAGDVSGEPGGDCGVWDVQSAAHVAARVVYGWGAAVSLSGEAVDGPAGGGGAGDDVFDRHERAWRRPKGADVLVALLSGELRRAERG